MKKCNFSDKDGADTFNLLVDLINSQQDSKVVITEISSLSMTLVIGDKKLYISPRAGSGWDEGSSYLCYSFLLNGVYKSIEGTNKESFEYSLTDDGDIWNH